MSDKWKHDNWHNNENNKHKCGIAEIDNCPYCRIKELEEKIGFVQTCKEHIVDDDIDCPICRIEELEELKSVDIEFIDKQIKLKAKLDAVNKDRDGWKQALVRERISADVRAAIGEQDE